LIKTAPQAPVVLPVLKWRESTNQSSRFLTKPNLIVWHETAGAYDGAVSWLCNPAANASAHFVIREDGREATQLVPIGRKAWHAGDFNRRSIGVEHANTTAKGYATDAQLRASARVFGFLCLRYGIPPRWAKAGMGAGVCRHSDLGAAGGGHTQCGPFDGTWRLFLEMLHDEVARGDYRAKWCR